MCTFATVTIAVLKTIQTRQSIFNSFSSFVEFEFPPTNFTETKEIMLDLKALSRSESHQNFVTVIETSLALNDKCFNTILISGGSFSSSTSSFISKIFEMERHLDAFGFNQTASSVAAPPSLSVRGNCRCARSPSLTSQR